MLRPKTWCRSKSERSCCIPFCSARALAPEPTEERSIEDYALWVTLDAAVVAVYGSLLGEGDGRSAWTAKAALCAPSSRAARPPLSHRMSRPFQVSYDGRCRRGCTCGRASARWRSRAAALASCFDCYVLYSTQYNKDKNTERLVCLHVTTVDSLVQVGQPAPLAARVGAVHTCTCTRQTQLAGAGVRRLDKRRRSPLCERTPHTQLG